jgi:hypothetical protein
MNRSGSNRPIGRTRRRFRPDFLVKCDSIHTRHAARQPILAGCGKTAKRRHSGGRAARGSPETMNTASRNQWLGLCSWIPGPALRGRPGMTGEFFRTLLEACAANRRRRRRSGEGESK